MKQITLSMQAFDAVQFNEELKIALGEMFKGITSAGKAYVTVWLDDDVTEGDEDRIAELAVNHTPVPKPVEKTLEERVADLEQIVGELLKNGSV